MVYDRDIDAVMDRTKNRPLVTGKMSPTAALAFALTLEVGAFALLALHRKSPLGRARGLSYRLLRARLHHVAKAKIGPEHRDRPARQVRCGPRRLFVVTDDSR